MGRALQTQATVGWSPREGWWCWDVPGIEHPLHFVQELLRQIQHRVRDNLRCHSSRQLEARRPVTFGGPGHGADGLACSAAIRAASTEIAARPHRPGPVDSGKGAGPWHAYQLRVPPLRDGA